MATQTLLGYMVAAGASADSSTTDQLLVAGPSNTIQDYGSSGLLSLARRYPKAFRTPLPIDRILTLRLTNKI